MAHAALLHLIQLLEEELIQFPCRVLKIEVKKARAFHFKRKKFLHNLDQPKILTHVPRSYVVDLRKELEPLALAIDEDLMDAARSPEVLLDSRPVLAKISDIQLLLEATESGLKDFVHSLDGEMISHPADSLSIQRDLATDLLASAEEFTKIIHFFNLVAEKAEIHYNTARLLFGKLKYFNHDVANRIKAAADKAGDCIEEFLTGNQSWWQKKDFMDDKNVHDLLEHVDRLLNRAATSNQVENEDDNTPTFGDSQPESSQNPQIRRPRGRLQGLANLASTDKIAELMIEATSDEKMPRSARKPRWERGFFLPVEPSESSIEVEDFGMAAVDGYVNNMIDELTGPPSGLTIMETSYKGGTSENSLLAKVFRHPNVADHFHCGAWVNGISSTDQVLSHILDTIGESCIEVHGDDVGELLYEHLRGRKYLVVLDGLQNFEVWDSLRRYFPDDNVGSRIVLNYVLKVESAREWSLKQEDIAVGLDDDLNKIIRELTSTVHKHLSIVTIAGMGGIGKTTLARKAFHHSTSMDHFRLREWVNNVTSTDQVLSHLLHNIVPSREETEGQTTDDKGELLWKSLRGIRYLIVVDGLWNFENWDAVQRYLPDDKKGSRILITTRETEFPTTCNILKNPPHSMTPLNRHQSWELLEKLVFGKESCPPGLVSVGQEIAERCRGLPLAIVAVAGILHSIPRSFSFWRSIIDDVTSIVSDDPEGCLDILALSYRKLPDHLQDCFRYMGAFPANCEIEVEYLLNLWMANGFLNYESRSHSETKAERYLNDLIVRSLVSVGKRRLDGKPRTCLVHNLVRELCLREAQKEDFMYVVEEGANAQDLEKQSHLIFNLNNLDDFELLPPLPRLRSFIWLYFGSDFTPGMVHLQLSVFKRLKVVDIYYLLFDSFPLQLLNLVSLRYLALQVTYELDASISQLLKLQTLVINGPWFLGEGDVNPTLYLEFWKMPWLRNVYVKVPSCLRYPQPLLDYPCPGSNIQSFSMMTFSSCTEEVFLLMPHLKKLGVSETKEDFQKGESAKCFQIFSFLAELETLKCCFYKGNREARSLGWDVLPVNLKSLSLKGSCLPWDRMKFLAWLPKLETLKLKDYAFQGPEWVLTDEVFCSLKQLLIDNTDLVKWEAESTDHFPSLERLVLRSCRCLEKIPCGELSVLELIELRNCSESAEDSAREFQEQYGGFRVVTRSDRKKVVEKGGQSSE